MLPAALLYKATSCASASAAHLYNPWRRLQVDNASKQQSVFTLVKPPPPAALCDLSLLVFGMHRWLEMYPRHPSTREEG